jgi:hypothetical protein
VGQVTVPDHAVVVELRDPKGAACAQDCTRRTYAMAPGEERDGQDRRSVWQANCWEACPTAVRHNEVDCRQWHDDRDKVCGYVTRTEQRDRSWIGAVVAGGVVVAVGALYLMLTGIGNGLKAM